MESVTTLSHFKRQLLYHPKLLRNWEIPKRGVRFWDWLVHLWNNIPRYNPEERPMDSITVESIPIVIGREEDGRWWADIESMPGVMAYGTTRESAIAAVRALALRVAADCIEHGEEIPEPFTKVFSVT
jgi:predicted RNase H-like HicB family nuclease